VAGVVVAPALGTAWVGADGVGAFEIAPNGEKTPIRVSEVGDLAAARLVVSRSHPSDRLRRIIGSLGISRIAARGSAGLKATDVASGRAEVYLQPGHAGKRWDTCAPEAIVQAAGGRCSDALGRPIDYAGPELENTSGFLATNAKLYDQVLERSKT
jgi:3'(2'), 5'-bisphosphate nucleotidase